MRMSISNTECGTQQLLGYQKCSAKVSRGDVVEFEMLFVGERAEREKEFLARQAKSRSGSCHWAIAAALTTCI